jgi:hypothetical protein
MFSVEVKRICEFVETINADVSLKSSRRCCLSLNPHGPHRVSTPVAQRCAGSTSLLGLSRTYDRFLARAPSRSSGALEAAG